MDEATKTRFDALEARLQKIERLLEEGSRRMLRHDEFIARMEGYNIEGMKKEIQDNRITISKIITVGSVVSFLLTIIVPVATAFLVKYL